MRKLISLFLLWMVCAAFGSLIITGVDVSKYPQVVIFAIVDLPDPYNSEFKIQEDGSTFYGSLASAKSLMEKPSVDFVVVFDITGSMDDEIEGMKRAVKTFADNVKSEGFDYRFSLVTFKDSVVKGDYGFTSNVDEFKKWLSGLYADGGGDTPEAALDALMYAMRLSVRRDAQKVLILITDAPYHYKGDGSGYSKYTVDDVRLMLEKRGFSLYSVSPKTREYTNLVKGYGKIFDIKNPRGMDGILGEIAETFTSQIAIVYDSIKRTEGEIVNFTLNVFYDGKYGKRSMTAYGSYRVPKLPSVGKETITAEGYGAVDPTLPGEKAILLAKEAAILDAKRLLLESLKSVYVTKTMRVEDMMLTSEEVKTMVDDVINGAEIIDENYDPDFGTYEVELKATYKIVYDPILKRVTFQPVWDKGLVVARGVVLIDKKMKPAGRAILMARRGAIAVAQSKLLEAIKGIHITAKTTVEDRMTEDVTIVAKLEGVLRGAVIVDEMKNHLTKSEIYSKGYYWVEMAVPINEEGKRYLAEMINQRIETSIADVVLGKKEPTSVIPKSSKYDIVVINANGKFVLFTLKGYALYSKDKKLVFNPSTDYKGGVPQMFKIKLEDAVEGKKAFIVKALEINTEEEYIVLDSDYNTLKKLLIDQGLGLSGSVVIVSDTLSSTAER